MPFQIVCPEAKLKEKIAILSCNTQAAQTRHDRRQAKKALITAIGQSRIGRRPFEPCHSQDGFPPSSRSVPPCHAHH